MNSMAASFIYTFRWWHDCTVYKITFWNSSNRYQLLSSVQWYPSVIFNELMPFSKASNRPNGVYINSVLYISLILSVNKTSFVANVKPKKVFIKQNLVKIFQKHFFLLFKKKQFNFQMKGTKLVDRQIKRQENLNLSFCGHL